MIWTRILNNIKESFSYRMKKLIKPLIIILILIIYLAISNLIKIYIPCPIKELTGFYCPGCGITRMFFSILCLDFYQAFRYNPLLFIAIIPSIFLYIDYLNNKEKSIYKKIPQKFWYFLIIILLIYGVLRNIPIFSFLAPTKI